MIYFLEYMEKDDYGYWYDEDCEYIECDTLEEAYEGAARMIHEMREYNRYKKLTPYVS